MICKDWDDGIVTVEMTRREVLEVLISVRNDLRNVSPDDDETRQILRKAAGKLLRCKG